MVGLDLGGHDTDEKIPVDLFVDNIKKYLEKGVQTDGSSVVLPKISELNDAQVDIIPDSDVNWFVDYNFDYIAEDTELPVGTLRIPSKLLHNGVYEVGSREILKKTVSHFNQQVKELIRKHPYVCKTLGIKSEADISEIVLTAATELEFWVKTPQETGDREQLSTSQELKEQYWQRTRGSVRTALERTIYILDAYGFGVEMGHKEVGGVKARLGDSGEYTHIMEQLEIDWVYGSAIQAADNELFIRYLVKDIFRQYGLEVSFMAKPMHGIAGSGEHTHLGVAAVLKSGKVVNLFSPKNVTDDFLNPIGYGALMGLLKNYEVVNPFVAASNDAMNRLKPGFEAPVCIVTSLGKDAASPSRNRTVLAGLVRDADNPLSVRFELRAPCPKCNSYLVMAAAYMAMLDGIEAVMTAEKTGEELEKALSKKAGEKVFYLEQDRVYRSEEDVFETFSAAERDALFGAPPRTVWENVAAFEKYPEKLNVLKKGGVFDEKILESYATATIAQWGTELQSRLIPDIMDLVRDCRKVTGEEEISELDVQNWEKVAQIRNRIAKDRLEGKALISSIIEALSLGDYDHASALQVELQEEEQHLRDAWIDYRRNII
jgi:glutamine synthetase